MRTQADYDRKYGISKGPTPAPLPNYDYYEPITISPPANSLEASYRRSEKLFPSYNQGPGSINLLDPFAEQREQAMREMVEDYTRQLNAPKVKEGPSMRAITREEYDMGTLRELQQMVSTNAIMTPQQRHEYDKLSMAYAGPLEKWGIFNGVVGGFTNGYGTPGGILNVYQKGPQVSTQQAPTGPTIRNAHLAGQVHPVTKIPFNKQGFPNFSSVAIKTVNIKQAGNYTTDFTAANKAAGLKSTPSGYTWHHHQNGKTMQLVPLTIHSQTGHTGGVGLKKQ